MKRKLLLFAIILTAILCVAAVASAVTCPFCHKGTLTEIEPLDVECCAITCDTCDANWWAYMHVWVCSETVCPCCGEPGLGGHQIDPDTGKCPCGYMEPVCDHDWSNLDGVCAKCKTECAHDSELIYPVTDDPAEHALVCNVCGCVLETEPHNLNENGHCPVCDYQCPHTTLNDGICVNCGYQVEIKIEVYTAVDKTPAVVESETVAEAKLGIDYNVLQRRTDLFTGAEQRKFLAQSKAAVWFDIKDAPALSEADAAALTEKLGKEPLGTLSLNIKLMKQFEKEEPVEVTGCDKLPVNLKLNPESIPAGTTAVLAVIEGVEEPIECEFNAETGEITFETSIFGIVNFVFI